MKHTGGLWECGEFEVVEDYEVLQFNDVKQCPHAKNLHVGAFDNLAWAVPYAVVAINEGGCNSTAVCLECILDAAKELGLISG